jgi:hypothetical protein
MTEFEHQVEAIMEQIQSLEESLAGLKE